MDMEDRTNKWDAPGRVIPAALILSQILTLFIGLALVVAVL